MARAGGIDPLYHEPRYLQDQMQVLDDTEIPLLFLTSAGSASRGAQTVDAVLPHGFLRAAFAPAGETPLQVAKSDEVKALLQ